MLGAAVFLPRVGAEYSYKNVPTAVAWAAYEETTAICKLTNKTYNQASGSSDRIDKNIQSLPEIIFKCGSNTRPIAMYVYQDSWKLADYL